MPARTIGEKLVFGNIVPLGLKGFPPGRYKVKLRCDEFARVYVRDHDGIRVFAVKEEDGYFVPGIEMERNLRSGKLPESKIPECGPAVREILARAKNI